MRGWKAINFEQFSAQCKYVTKKILGSKYAMCCDKTQSMCFCCVDCRYWRKLGRADIKVSKITANNNSRQVRKASTQITPMKSQCNRCGCVFINIDGCPNGCRAGVTSAVL